MRARSTRPVASVRERAILANAQHWSGSIESVMTRRAATTASPGDARPLLTISRVHCIRPYNISTIWNLCTSDHRTGAEYWAGQRSLATPGSCQGSPAFAAGCNEAKARLTLADALRRKESEYKRGWNAYGQ